MRFKQNPFIWKKLSRMKLDVILNLIHYDWKENDLIETINGLVCHNLYKELVGTLGDYEDHKNHLRFEGDVIGSQILYKTQERDLQLRE